MGLKKNEVGTQIAYIKSECTKDSKNAIINLSLHSNLKAYIFQWKYIIGGITKALDFWEELI